MRDADLRERSRRAFDAQAATYDEAVFGSHARTLYPAVVAELTDRPAAPPARLLDLGCGTGALTELVAEALPDARLCGLDLSSGMLDRARARLGGRPDLGSRIELVRGDAERLPFCDRGFDAVFCCDSFHHYPDPGRAAHEVWRVLAPGGFFVLADTWMPAPARWLANALMPLGHEGDVRIYSERELRAILGRWFGLTGWRRMGRRAQLAVAVKG